MANGEPIHTEYFSDYKLYEFEETKPLSTYLFAYRGGRFSCVERYVGGRWIGIYHRETDTSKINASIPVIARGKSCFGLDGKLHGIRYPFDVYNVVAIPDFQYSGDGASGRRVLPGVNDVFGPECGFIGMDETQ